MRDQPKAEPYEAAGFFEDGLAMRRVPEGTVARNDPAPHAEFASGMEGGRFVATIPHELTPEMLERGRERYTIYCAPCHDHVGTGLGPIVQAGLRNPAPPTFHSERLRDVPDGYLFDVMTNGFGAMYSYKDRVSAQDRWAIAGYVRALQLSQSAPVADLPEEDQRTLSGTIR
jgi:mono/diheme cytochrome c family protein